MNEKEEPSKFDTDFALLQSFVNAWKDLENYKSFQALSNPKLQKYIEGLITSIRLELILLCRGLRKQLKSH